MLKTLKIKILLLLITTIIISSYLLISAIIGNDNFQNLKLLLNNEQKQLIKRYIFPYKLISQQQQTISQQQQTISQQKFQQKSQQKQTKSQQQQILKLIDFLDIDFLDIELEKKNRR